MSWSHSVSIESKQEFLLRLLEIDIDRVIEEKLAERGLRIEREAVVANPAADEYGPAELRRLELSDGAVFEQRLVDSQTGEDWGRDVYEFRPVGEDRSA